MMMEHSFSSPWLISKLDVKIFLQYLSLVENNEFSITAVRLA